MRILLLSLWKPSRGGVVTHVKNLIDNSANDFVIISYPPVRIPLLRAAGYVLAGLLKGLRLRFDVIHAHYAVPQGLLGVLLKKIKKKPLVVTLHGSDMTVLGRNPLTRPLVAYVLKEADRVIAVSGFLRNEALRIGGDEEKTKVIRGGVSPGKRPRKEVRGKNTVLFIGGLVKQKGADILVKAFKRVMEKHNAELVIVGDGPERASLERLCRELGVAAEFTGYVEDTRNVLRKSSVLVLPSREEGFGLVLLEAMALGIPVVATRVGGIQEIIADGENGLLVEREDPEALAEAISRVLEDPGLRSRLVSKGFETLAGFSWEKMAGEVDDVYRELAEENKNI